MTGLAKVKGVTEWLDNILDNKDCKFILYAHHLDVMNELEKYLVKKLKKD